MAKALGVPKGTLGAVLFNLLTLQVTLQLYIYKSFYSKIYLLFFASFPLLVTKHHLYLKEIHISSHLHLEFYSMNFAEASFLREVARVLKVPARVPKG